LAIAFFASLNEAIAARRVLAGAQACVCVVVVAIVAGLVANMQEAITTGRSLTLVRTGILVAIICIVTGLVARVEHAVTTRWRWLAGRRTARAIGDVPVFGAQITAFGVLNNTVATACGVTQAGASSSRGIVFSQITFLVELDQPITTPGFFTGGGTKTTRIVLLSLVAFF